MSRGGKRANAGRKPGSTDKKPRRRPVSADDAALTSIDVMRDAMLQLRGQGKFLDAALIAAKLAPYEHSPFARNSSIALPHPRQVAAPDLFDETYLQRSEGIGKKAQEAAAATAAVTDPESDWGSDLQPGPPN